MTPRNRMVPCPECGGRIHVLVDVTVHPLLAREPSGRLVYGGFATRPLEGIKRQLAANGVQSDPDLGVRRLRVDGPHRGPPELNLQESGTKH